MPNYLQPQTVAYQAPLSMEFSRQEYWTGLPFPSPELKYTGEESACNTGVTGDVDSIPGLAKSPKEGNSNPLQYSFLKNRMDRGAWQALVQWVAKSRTRLSD